MIYSVEIQSHTIAKSIVDHCQLLRSSRIGQDKRPRQIMTWQRATPARGSEQHARPEFEIPGTLRPAQSNLRKVRGEGVRSARHGLDNRASAATATPGL
jgi:hypothetical protein